MPPTYPVVKVHIVILFRGIARDDVSANLLEVIRRAVARILRIPVNRVVITSYDGVRRLVDHTIRALEDGDDIEGLTVEFDLEADSDELLSDDDLPSNADGAKTMQQKQSPL